MALFAQYSNASNFRNFLYGNEDYIGLNSYLNIDYKDYYDNFFNVLTIAGTQDDPTDQFGPNGLDNWGILLGMSRNVLIPDTRKRFGFGDDTVPTTMNGWPQSFNYGAFYSGATLFTPMADDIYRCMLMMRYQTLTSNMSILSITNILNNFFINLNTFGLTNAQTVNVQDNLAEMSITYTFTETLLPYQTAIFNTEDSSTNYLPRPTSVAPIIVQP